MTVVGEILIWSFAFLQNKIPSSQTYFLTHTNFILEFYAFTENKTTIITRIMIKIL